MRRGVGWIAAAALAAAACSGDDECARSRDAEGRVVLDCPRVGRVTLAGEPPESAICRAEGDRVRCGAESYGLDGAELPGRTDPGGDAVPPGGDAGDPGDNAGDAGFGPPLPGPPGSGATRGASSPCRLIADEITCADGARARLTDAERGALGEGAARCSSRLLPGSGRRVVCRADDPSLAIALEAEAGSVDESEREVRCARDGLEITCTDGTRYAEGEGSGGPLDSDPGACAEPALAPPDPDASARCLESIGCPEAGCSASDLAPGGAECAEALSPRLMCDGEVLELPARCYAPDLTIAIRTEADFARYAALDCDAIWGDVEIAPLEAPPGGESAPVDLDWLRALGRARAIYGSLTIEGGLVPDSDEERREFARIVEGLELSYVSGDLRFARNEGVRGLDSIGELRRVRGALNFEANPDLRALGVVRTGQRLGSLSVNGNPALALLTWFVPRLGPIEGIERPRVDGAFIFAANPRYDPCLLPSLTSWGLKQASEVLVSGGGGDSCD